MPQILPLASMSMAFTEAKGQLHRTDASGGKQVWCIEGIRGLRQLG